MAVEIKGYIASDNDQPIYSLYGYTTTAPGNIRQAIAEANGGPLDVEISTCYGGDIFAGSEIYSALRGYSGGVNIRVTGLAASAASVIAMAGPNEMSPTAQLMVHRVSATAQGNYHDMDDASGSLQQADKAMAAAYEAKSGMAEKDALKLMDNETWITAAHAVELGLVDKVSDAAVPQLVNSAFGLPLPRAVIEKTRAMLAEQKALTKEPEPTEPHPAEPNAQAIARAKLDLIEKALNF